MNSGNADDIEGLKSRGNDAFAREEYELALETYQKAAALAKALVPRNCGATALSMFAPEITIKNLVYFHADHKIFVWRMGGTIPVQM